MSGRTAPPGKVAEPFGEIISEWKTRDLGGKQKRLRFLCDKLMLNVRAVNDIHYQLLHRTAAVVTEARRFNAPIALMFVHAFKKTREKYDESFKAYCRFLALFGGRGEINSLVFDRNIDGISLYFAWVKEKYLKM